MSEFDKPRRGSLAVCQWGILGVISEDVPKFVTYANGKQSVVWVGYRVDQNMNVTNSLWSSKRPKVVGCLENY